MRNRDASTSSTVLTAILIAVQSDPASQRGCEIPFRSDVYLIVMEASIGKKDGLRFMIETAATHTAVDGKVLKALGLEQMSGDSLIATLGRSQRRVSFTFLSCRSDQFIRYCGCIAPKLIFPAWESMASSEPIS